MHVAPPVASQEGFPIWRLKCERKKDTVTQTVLGKLSALPVNPQGQPRGHPLKTSNGLWCLRPYWDGLEQHLAQTSTNVPDLHLTSILSVKNPILLSSKFILKAEFSGLMDSTRVHRKWIRTGFGESKFEQILLAVYFALSTPGEAWMQKRPEPKGGGKLKRSKARRCFGVMIFYVLTKCISPQMISRFIVSKSWHTILTCVLD